MRVIQPPFGKRIAKGGQGRTARVVVDVLQGDDIGVGGDNDFDRGGGTVIEPQDIAQDLARAAPRQVGVIGGKPQRFGIGGGCGDPQRDQEGKADFGASASTPAISLARRARIMRATWIIAIPRIRRLRGRNIHIVIAQTIV